MLGAVDHVGYLARDLEATIAEFSKLFAVQVARRIERPAFSLIGAYLGSGEGNIEVFTFTETALLGERLGEERVILDHVAFEVADIAATAAGMSAAGVSFCGPDARAELSEPVDFGGVLHLWTRPASSAGQMLQILQR
jgi:catechol 2,3-dioxygenase-like lactoylglutathione lyase family enzyme